MCGRYIREHADQYGVDPEKVGAMGFSAGGDLCLRTGLSSDPLVKPDFLCPVYPAVPVRYVYNLRSSSTFVLRSMFVALGFVRQQLTILSACLPVI
eukprot:COSAG02_NODE_14774_length_1237_cov_1.672232_1_plen_96_part_00